jgi:hypothetical protein
MVYSECSPQLCPCKELCSNQRIQRHEWAPGLEKFMTKDKVDPAVFHEDVIIIISSDLAGFVSPCSIMYEVM